MQDTKTTETDIEQQAAQFAARVAQHFKHTRDWTKAFTLAQDEDEVGATAYRLRGRRCRARGRDTGPDRSVGPCGRVVRRARPALRHRARRLAAAGGA